MASTAGNCPIITNLNLESRWNTSNKSQSPNNSCFKQIGISCSIAFPSTQRTTWSAPCSLPNINIQSTFWNNPKPSKTASTGFHPSFTGLCHLPGGGQSPSQARDRGQNRHLRQFVRFFFENSNLQWRIPNYFNKNELRKLRCIIAQDRIRSEHVVTISNVVLLFWKGCHLKHTSHCCYSCYIASWISKSIDRSQQAVTWTVAVSLRSLHRRQSCFSCQHIACQRLSASSKGYFAEWEWNCCLRLTSTCLLIAVVAGVTTSSGRGYIISTRLLSIVPWNRVKQCEV